MEQRCMKQKKFTDYLDPLPPLHRQFNYAANMLLILKIAGELEKMDWGFVF
jgi:hypothetical protein